MKNNEKSGKGFIEKLKSLKNGKIRNTALFRRGGYSVILTAIVLVALVFINFLVGKLDQKVGLEFDMTADKTNSMSAENIKYIKGVKDTVSVTVCADKSEYTNYMISESQETYQTVGNEDYFNQTIKFLEKYGNLNDKIHIKYVDIQSSEFASVTKKYPDMNIAYGDIIVSCTKNGNTRSKQLSFKSIYSLFDETGYAAYGLDFYQIDSNNLESALTSAISYVTSAENYKIIVYCGHSKVDYSSTYATMLEANNYDVTVVTTPFIPQIPDDVDCLALMAPATDFIDSEIIAIQNFLENGGKGGKGLIYFGDAVNPALPKLNSFLYEWGITVDDGMLFETNTKAIPNGNMRTALFSLPNTQTDFTDDMNYFITGYNIPMAVSEEVPDGINVFPITSTLETVVNVPSGKDENWEGMQSAEQMVFDTVIESKTEKFEKASYVFAFSSIEFISSDWAENSSISNKNLVLQVSDIASGNVAKNMSFVPKKITSPSYAGDITDADSNRINRIFVIFVPIAVILFGIVVFIKRRNSK